MRRTRHLPVCGILSAISAMGIGCAPQQPAPPRDVTNPQWTSELDGYVRAMPLGADMFQAPPGQVLVYTTTRPSLEAMRRPGDGSQFDNGARPLFYMGSDDDWDYYYVADHAFGLFWRVRREHNPQGHRMPLTGNSLAWREVREKAAATTKADAATRP
jgi:hypothetical protein